MSLSLLQETTPIIYELCQPGDGAVYNPDLCTAPRIYRETFFNTTNSIRGMWYDSKTDEYVLFVLMRFTLWPSYRTNVYRISPETGLVTSQELGFAHLGFNLQSYENGEFNKLYAYSPGLGVFEVDTTLLTTLGPVIVSDSEAGGFDLQPFVINRKDSLLVVDRVGELQIWDYSTTTLLGTFGIPALDIDDMAYEDNERAWAVMPSFDGIPTVMKFNYKDRNIESMSAIQASGATDFQTMIAYDSKRKVVAIFRQRADAVDGAAQHVLGLYKPFAIPTNITEPVPVGTLEPGKVTTFVANMFGDRGEMGQLKTVTVTNTGDGTILQPTVTPRTNGAVGSRITATGTCDTLASTAVFVRRTSIPC